LENATVIDLQTRYWLEYNHSSNRHNLKLDSVPDAVDELARFKRCGGSIVVELTTTGIAPRGDLLRQVMRESGVTIVRGCGYYVDATRTSDERAMSEDDMCERIVEQIERGDEHNVRAGIIGEIGCSWPLAESERCALRAAAKAQRRTGASISVHPGRDVRAPLEIAELLSAAGADMSRVIIGHLDRTVPAGRLDALLELARRFDGIVLEWDLFGIECSKYWFDERVDMPSDAQRIDTIKSLLDAEPSMRNRIVVSHDIYSKHRLATYGGHGYSHLLERIVPRMRLRGIAQGDIDCILTANPLRLLTICNQK
jgi:phosphotriesterase-related protein